nr:ribonuclease H-like domain-containing protein [Tanacetum cinerariifolium]
MTTDNPSPTPALTLSDKLMAMNHLTTFVPKKLDVDAMNYSSWVYYFSHLCHGYGILDHLVDPVASLSTVTPTDPPPKDAKWTKIDFIIRSWIFSTFAPSLRKCLVDLNPTTAKDAWTYIAEFRVQNPLVDATSASPMVLLAKSNTSARRGPSLEKVNNPCWSFAKGSYRFGDAFAYTVSVPPGFPSVSAQLSAQPTYVSPQLLPSSFGGVQYGNGWVIPTGGSVSDGVTAAGGLLSTARGSDAFCKGVLSLVRFTWDSHLVCLFIRVSCLCSQGSGQATLLPNAFNTTTLQDSASGSWNMDTGASSHLNDSVHYLSDILNMCIYPSVAVGDGRFIPVTNSGHSVLSTLFRPLRLNNVLITPNIVKNLISVRQFVRENSYTVEFDPFGFSVKDFITRRVLPRCDSTSDLYPVTKPSTIPHAFLTNQYTWHQRLGHPGSEVLRRLVSSDSISCNKEKLPILCHACHLGKHLKFPFVRSSSSVTSCLTLFTRICGPLQFQVFPVSSIMFCF